MRHELVPAVAAAAAGADGAEAAVATAAVGDAGGTLSGLPSGLVLILVRRGWDLVLLEWSLVRCVFG